MFVNFKNTNQNHSQTMTYNYQIGTLKLRLITQLK